MKNAYSLDTTNGQVSRLHLRGSDAIVWAALLQVFGNGEDHGNELVSTSRATMVDTHFWSDRHGYGSDSLGKSSIVYTEVQPMEPDTRHGYPIDRDDYIANRNRVYRAFFQTNFVLREGDKKRIRERRRRQVLGQAPIGDQGMCQVLYYTDVALCLTLRGGKEEHSDQLDTGTEEDRMHVLSA